MGQFANIWAGIVASALSVWASVDISFVDGGWVFCALSFPCLRAFNHKVIKRRRFPHSLVLLLDLLRGAAFFPFIILIIGVVSTPLLMHFVEHERITLLLAGLIGASAVFKSDKWIVDAVRANPAIFED